MQLSVLASGSNANATVVVEDGHALVIDCGLSAREFLKRLHGEFGEVDIDAILLTHEHSDHLSGVRPLARKTGTQLHSVAATLEKATGTGSLEGVETREVVQMERTEIGPFVVTPIPVSHDAVDPVGYRVESGGKVVTVSTDLGYVNDELRESLVDSDVVVLEANHDLEMLLNGSYPIHLIERIVGMRGHLSNEDSAGGIAEAGPSVAFLAHLSQDNNTPQKAEATVIETLEERDVQTEVFLTYRDRATKAIDIP